MTKDTEQTANIGVNAVEGIFLNTFGWIFRAQDKADHGIDAHAEMKRRGQATGRLFGLQIRTGRSHLDSKGKDYVFRSENKRHLEYWANHILPVYLIFHLPDEGVTLWQRFDRDKVRETPKGWSIDVPAKNIMDTSAIRDFERGKPKTLEELRRLQFQGDLDLIEEIDESGAKFRFNVDKSGDFEGVKRMTAIIKEKNGKWRWKRSSSYSDPAFTIEEIMREDYWYLDYEYAEPVVESNDEEQHVLLVSLTSAVKGYLEVENILRNGAPEKSHIDVPYRPAIRFIDDIDESDAE